jgi:formamidopyrimidine-DNA glycosylase
MAFEWWAGLKALPGLLKRINDLQMFEASLEHRERVVRLSEENDALRRTLAERDAKVAELTTFLSLRGQMHFARNVYWRGNEGPFCPRCFDNDGKLIRLTTSSVSRGFHHCPNCQSGFETER